MVIYILKNKYRVEEQDLKLWVWFSRFGEMNSVFPASSRGDVYVSRVRMTCLNITREAFRHGMQQRLSLGRNGNELL